MKVPEKVKFILDTIESAGARADIVGGPVRDFLLGNEPSDYDITTSARPEEIKRIFSEYRTVDTGIKHGTVSLILDGEQYEITTYRVDGEYKDSRHPESVSFTTRIEDDLSRRDFTVNAMAYSDRHGITDAFGGRGDLDARLIRAVGDPEERFREDALRILRAVRFAAVLGFRIEEKTADAARRCAYLIDNISAERCYTELRKLFGGEYAYPVIERFSDIILRFAVGVDALTLPMRTRFDEASTMTRVLSLFAHLGERASAVFSETMRRLKSPTAPRELGERVLDAVGKYKKDSARLIGRALYALGEDCLRELIRLEILLGTEDSTALSRLDLYLAYGLPYRISDLSIGGSELTSMGIRGRAIGEMLERMLLAVIDGECENNPEALSSFARVN